MPITLSAAAATLHPGLERSIAAAGPGARALHVAADGEAGEITVAASLRPSIERDGGLRLAFAAADTAFAGAVIAAAARGDDVPAGADPASRALLGLAAKVAARDVTVLIAGPTGTGKEGLARFIHARSPRHAGPFVAVNCAAIPDTMLEATLFGYERGAFAGASGSAPGLFRAANGGTLLLDEVTELPLALQAKLLRALQEREVLPVGATVPVAIDARIVATANRDLGGEVSAGRFRADLFYRLAVLPLTTTALARLAAHRWPGNVRELGNVLARAAIFAEDGVIEAADIVFDTLSPPGGALAPGVRAHEFAVIRATLAACAGRRADTARRLGISERTLRYKLAAMGDVPPSATLQ